MRFTFAEWGTIKHNMEVAYMEYERLMQDSKPSDDPLSFYQGFKRQMEQTAALIKKIETAEI